MEEKCLICEKELYRSNNGRSIKKRVGHNKVTCGGKCSKAYCRVNKYIIRRNRK